MLKSVLQEMENFHYSISRKANKNSYEIFDWKTNTSYSYSIHKNDVLIHYSIIIVDSENVITNKHSFIVL